jgi:hypothetical protein
VKTACWLLTITGCGFIALSIVLPASLPAAGIAAVAGNGVAAILAGLWCGVVAWRRDRRAAEYARVLATGLAGTGTITSAEVARPRWLYAEAAKPVRTILLAVRVAGRPGYEATVNRPIAYSDLPRYQPGCAFGVRVDPDRPGVVAIVDSANVTWAAVALSASVPGAAVVTGLFDPVVPGTEAPVWGLILRVQAADGRPSYDVRLSILPADGIARPRRKARLTVRIDPDDPRRIAVDWAGMAGWTAGVGGAAAWVDRDEQLRSDTSLAPHLPDQVVVGRPERPKQRKKPERNWSKIAKRLADTGLTAFATVTGLEQHRYWTPGDPKCWLTLNIALPGRAVYEVRVIYYIWPDQMPLYQPGRRFQVLVDADDLATVGLIDPDRHKYMADHELISDQQAE